MEEKRILKREDIHFLILHHSATPRDRTTFEAVKRFHIEKRGFWDIGYHFFIDGQAKLHVGRPSNYIGAHCSANFMNFRSLGICLAGNFEFERPSLEQLGTLEKLLDNLRADYKIPLDNILGHREVNGAATLCPGIYLLEWLEKYRRRKKKLLEIAKILQAIREILDRLRKLLPF